MGPTIGLSLDTGELNDLVGADAAIFRNREFGLDGEDGIVFHTGSRRRRLYQRPAAEQSVVGVAAIHGHDGTGIQSGKIRPV